MDSVSTLDRPTAQKVEVTPSAVKANNIDVAVTNGCVFLTLPDEASFEAFTAGLKEKGTLFSLGDKLTVRFFVRNNH